MIPDSKDNSSCIGFLLSLGQKGEGIHTIGRLLGPLLQTVLLGKWAQV